MLIIQWWLLFMMFFLNYLLSALKSTKDWLYRAVINSWYKTKNHKNRIQFDSQFWIQIKCKISSYSWNIFVWSVNLIRTLLCQFHLYYRSGRVQRTLTTYWHCKHLLPETIWQKTYISSLSLANCWKLFPFWAVAILLTSRLTREILHPQICNCRI